MRCVSPQYSIRLPPWNSTLHVPMKALVCRGAPMALADFLGLLPVTNVPIHSGRVAGSTGRYGWAWAVVKKMKRRGANRRMRKGEGKAVESIVLGWLSFIQAHLDHWLGLISESSIRESLRRPAALR